MQDLIHLGYITCKKIHTTLNAADILTKYVDSTTLQRHLEKLCLLQPVTRFTMSSFDFDYEETIHGHELHGKEFELQGNQSQLHEHFQICNPFDDQINGSLSNHSNQLPIMFYWNVDYDDSFQAWCDHDFPNGLPVETESSDDSMASSTSMIESLALEVSAVSRGDTTLQGGAGTLGSTLTSSGSGSTTTTLQFDPIRLANRTTAPLEIDFGRVALWTWRCRLNFAMPPNKDFMTTEYMNFINYRQPEHYMQFDWYSTITKRFPSILTSKLGQSIAFSTHWHPPFNFTHDDAHCDEVFFAAITEREALHLLKTGVLCLRQKYDVLNFHEKPDYAAFQLHNLLNTFTEC